MQQLLIVAVLSALVLITQADTDIKCSDHLKVVGTYEQAVGRWVQIYDWNLSPGNSPSRRDSKRSEISLTFTVPTPEDITNDRNPNVTVDKLTDHPKLLVQRHTSSPQEKVLLDVSDKMFIVNGYYDKVEANHLNIKRIGDFLTVEYVFMANGEYRSAEIEILHKNNRPDEIAAESTAACVEMEYLTKMS